MKQDAGAGIILVLAVQILLIGLRIFEVIHWPWAVVLLPILIPAGFAALVLITAVIAAVIKEVFRRM